MGKDRSARVIAIMALIIGVVGISIGFAAFSNNLNITSEANVYTDPNQFKVVFSTKSDAITTAGVTDTISPVNSSSSKLLEDKPNTITIDNGSASGPRITDIVANFDAPGQSVTYKFYAVNNGEYNAFLKNLTASPITENGNDYMTCTAVEEEGKSTADATLLKKACSTIKLSVTIAGKTLEISNSLVDGENVSSVSGADSAITGKELARDTVSDDSHIGDSHEITLTISYDNTQQKVDGDFKVEFGDINLVYSSVD